MDEGAFDRMPVRVQAATADAVKNIQGWKDALFGEQTPLGAFAALDVPVLLMVGTRSPLSSRAVARRLAGTLPKVELEDGKPLAFELEVEVLPEFDGTPDTWFTINGIVGPEYVSNDYNRPNSNQAAPFWYHDHAFGVTRLDVGFGLSGFAILRDPAGEPLDRQGNEDILGFEDPNDWISTVAAIQPGISTNKTQGRFSLSLPAKN